MIFFKLIAIIVLCSKSTVGSKNGHDSDWIKWKYFNRGEIFLWSVSRNAEGKRNTTQEDELLLCRFFDAAKVAYVGCWTQNGTKPLGFNFLGTYDNPEDRKIMRHRLIVNIHHPNKTEKLRANSYILRMMKQYQQEKQCYSAKKVKYRNKTIIKCEACNGLGVQRLSNGHVDRCGSCLGWGIVAFNAEESSEVQRKQYYEFQQFIKDHQKYANSIKKYPCPRAPKKAMCDKLLQWMDFIKFHENDAAIRTQLRNRRYDIVTNHASPSKVEEPPKFTVLDPKEQSNEISMDDLKLESAPEIPESESGSPSFDDPPPPRHDSTISERSTTSTSQHVPPEVTNQIPQCKRCNGTGTVSKGWLGILGVFKMQKNCPDCYI